MVICSLLVVIIRMATDLWMLIFVTGDICKESYGQLILVYRRHIDDKNERQNE